MSGSSRSGSPVRSSPSSGATALRPTSAAAAVVRPSRVPTAAQARAYLESLPNLWAKTSDAGRHAIAEPVYERIDVLGATDFTFVLTAHAKAHGWNAAFGAGDQSISIGRSGRGERSRPTLSNCRYGSWAAAQPAPELSGASDVVRGTADPGQHPSSAAVSDAERRTARTSMRPRELDPIRRQPPVQRGREGRTVRNPQQSAGLMRGSRAPDASFTGEANDRPENLGLTQSGGKNRGGSVPACRRLRHRRRDRRGCRPCSRRSGCIR